MKEEKKNQQLQPITEEMGVHKEWYIEARKVTEKTLPEFIRHITEDYSHDYGTICHALASAAVAAANAVNHSPEGGITGFQAGAVMWEFIRHWNYEDNKSGMKIVDYDQMLYPQSDYKFDKTISKSTWEVIQKMAKENLEEKQEHAHPNVISHWESIVNGKIPFGYTIKDED